MTKAEEKVLLTFLTNTLLNKLEDYDNIDVHDDKTAHIDWSKSAYIIVDIWDNGITAKIWS